ncbi:MAG: type IX secretion system membrane protein PorP/SprF [Crocinitomicaceae bacterium]|nr:type IX secretion system membrane protein PorP/SprF [Crocinitomicaceae bacterium]
MMVLNSDAQQISRRSQFMINTYMVNPAAAGTLRYSPFFISYRSQWAGFKAGPTTAMASGNTPLKKGIGVGAIFYHDDAGGAVSESGTELTGSYRFALNNKDNMSLGLSANLSQYRFDNSKLVVLDPNDLALNGGITESHFNMDATFGLLIYGNNYYAGFSVPQLIQTKLNLNSEVLKGNNMNVRHYQFMGSYKQYLNDDWDIQPSIMLKFTDSTPVQADINVRTNFLGKYYFGMTYRPGDAWAFMIGARHNDFAFSYSYDLTTTAAKTLSPHSHEILIGYYLPEKKGHFRTHSIGPTITDKNRIIN